MLIVDNVERMHPSTLGVINSLANIEVEGKHAIRFILAGTRSLQNLIDSPGMSNVAEREPHAFTMEPLSAKDQTLVRFSTKRCRYLWPERRNTRGVCG